MIKGIVTTLIGTSIAIAVAVADEQRRQALGQVVREDVTVSPRDLAVLSIPKTGGDVVVFSRTELEHF